ncbi:hypothetical protein ACFL5O_11185 [Myxococcota bacterium]
MSTRLTWDGGVGPALWHAIRSIGGFPSRKKSLYARLPRPHGVPQIRFSLFGTEGSHNGAAGHVPEATASGILCSEAILTTPLVFRIYASRQIP